LNAPATILITPLTPSAPLSLPILPAPAPTSNPALDAAWAALQQTQPRLFDGPILLAERRGDHVSLRPSTYRHLATAPRLNPSLRAFGVQGLLIARDARDTPHLLLARRSGEVRIYAGLWENAPSGTLSLPLATSTPGHLDTSALIHALAAEGTEELGLDITHAPATPIALLDDAEANSLDVVLRIDLPEPINPRTLPCPTSHNRWEYADTAWIALPDREPWCTKNAHAISPPTRTLLSWLNSLGEPRAE
jgi:hypothetical protein